jgi:hypothetical protein
MSSLEVDGISNRADSKKWQEIRSIFMHQQ